MSPILNVEFKGDSIKQEVTDLRTGLIDCLGYLRSCGISHEAYTNAVELLNNDAFTISSMKKLRDLLPDLKVTGHYFELADSQILDRS